MCTAFEVRRLLRARVQRGHGPCDDQRRTERSTDHSLGRFRNAWITIPLKGYCFLQYHLQFDVIMIIATQKTNHFSVDSKFKYESIVRSRLKIGNFCRLHISDRFCREAYRQRLQVRLVLPHRHHLPLALLAELRGGRAAGWRRTGCARRLFWTIPFWTI